MTTYNLHKGSHSSPGKPIADVAKLSGFASPQYFSRFFKNRIGITAEEFRSRGG